MHVRPGGAGLAAALAVADGRPVTLVTALAGDPAALELRDALDRAGVSIVDLALDGTTAEKIRITTGGRSLLRLDRGGENVVIGPMSAAAREAIGWAAAVLVADYGRGVATQPSVREALAFAASFVPVVWDPHPNGPLPCRMRMVTPNLAEAAAVEPAPAATTPRRPRRVRPRSQIAGRRPTSASPAARAAPCSPVRTARGRSASRPHRPQAATRAGRVTASPAALRAPWPTASIPGPRVVPRGRGSDPVRRGRRRGGRRPARVREQGGTIVATGGCFDLLHPGHVRTLEAARALCDCLVVCLNSDASVRRLKGPGRPVVGEEDRAAVLRALRCVDEVVIFDEDTPTLLKHLRPDVWVKGGDYAPEDLPEAEVIARWGGRVALLPSWRAAPAPG